MANTETLGPGTLILGNIVTPAVLTKGTTDSSGGTFAAATYFWVVVASGAWGDSARSNEVTAVIAANGTQVLSWTAVTGATGYKIYRSTTAGTYPASALVASVGSGVLTYTDTGTAPTAGTPGTGPDGIAVECQFKETALEPDFDEGDDDQTLCGDTVAGEDVTKWSLNGELYQDWSMTGINKWSIDHNGQQVNFSFTPKTGDGPTATGKLKMRALPVGGKTREKLTAKVEWPVVGNPNWSWV